MTDAELYVIAAMLTALAAEEDAAIAAQPAPIYRPLMMQGGTAPIPDEEEDFMQTTVTLTDDQIKHLPNSVIEIIPAQGAGKLIVPFVYVFSFAGTTPYGTIGVNSTFGITGLMSGYDYTPTTKLKLTGFLTATPPQQYLTVLSGGNDNEFKVGPNDETNQGLGIYSSNGGDDFTDGNAANTLKITVIYQIITL